VRSPLQLAEPPVPAGFTITTDACRAYMATGGELPPGLEDEIEEHIARLEHATGSGFGNPINPLLVSVRSGAAISMPGMMDTILDLGLNDETALGLAATANGRFAYDSYRRLIQMYGEVVEGIDGRRFEQALTELKARVAAMSIPEVKELLGAVPTVVSRSCEFEDLEGSVHDAAGLAAGFGDVASAGEMVGADCEVAQAGHDAGS